jgi:hypothetical protein
LKTARQQNKELNQEISGITANKTELTKYDWFRLLCHSYWKLQSVAQVLLMAPINVNPGGRGTGGGGGPAG